MQLAELMQRLNARAPKAKLQGYMTVTPIEFNLYANIFGNMEKNTSVAIHAGRKSLTFKGIELRAL